MLGFLTSGPDYFPGWVSIAFSVGLALGIVHHLPCLIFGHGNRWFHAGHTAMAVSMIYMFLSMSYYWNWLPAAWQMSVLRCQFGRDRRVPAHQGHPRAGRQLPLDSLAGTAGSDGLHVAPHDGLERDPHLRARVVVCHRDIRLGCESLAGRHPNAREPSMVPSRNSGQKTWSATSPGTTDRDSRFSDITVDRYRGVVRYGLPPERSPRRVRWKDRTLMAIMALSMGYMFYGMELLAMAMPPMP